MTSVVVAGLMWLLVAALLILRWGRVERGITWASVTIAVSMTLNIDPVYVALDGLLGGTNIVTLIADVALMTGVFLLGRGVMKAADRQPRTIVRLALSPVTYVAAVVGAAFAFFAIDRGATTTVFMLDLGGQPAAAIYSMIHFTYYAIVLAAMAAVAAHQALVSRGILTAPPILLVVGCVFGIALTVDVVVMDLAHIAGNLDLMEAAATMYSPLHLMTFLFLCSGFAGQPASRAFKARARARTTRMLTRELAPAWNAASAVHPGISQQADAAFDPADPEALLHRQVVEIRDAMIDTRVVFTISDADRMVLDRAERHLVGADSTSTRHPQVQP
ncbi:DUF6545 domain-containing protein [Agromyces laixinhei]|uniref:DUF6545 domain-containing protein n=1 Tax=Agromyces laixinhei TaxID=2585717 RepID=UPI0012EEDBDC|nr:DUF6545 domain-containing protein [Agromyces laixinhei]